MDARPSLDYDPRYGNDGSWTTAMFVEAVYRDLAQHDDNE
jgi:hypothetical protein